MPAPPKQTEHSGPDGGPMTLLDKLKMPGPDGISPIALDRVESEALLKVLEKLTDDQLKILVDNGRQADRRIREAGGKPPHEFGRLPPPR
jgi:hypothetical protein